MAYATESVDSWQNALIAYHSDTSKSPQATWSYATNPGATSPQGGLAMVGGSPGAGFSFKFTGVEVLVNGPVNAPIGGCSPPVSVYSVDGSAPVTFTAPNVTTNIDDLEFFDSGHLALGEHVLVTNITQASAGCLYALDYITYIAPPGDVLPTASSTAPAPSSSSSATPSLAAPAQPTSPSPQSPSPQSPSPTQSSPSSPQLSSAAHQSSSFSSSQSLYSGSQSASSSPSLSSTVSHLSYSSGRNTTAAGGPTGASPLETAASSPSSAGMAGGITHKSSTPIGAIVGGVVGGIAGLTVLLILLILWYRRRNASDTLPDPYVDQGDNDKGSVPAVSVYKSELHIRHDPESGMRMVESMPNEGSSSVAPQSLGETRSSASLLPGTSSSSEYPPTPDAVEGAANAVQPLQHTTTSSLPAASSSPLVSPLTAITSPPITEISGQRSSLVHGRSLGIPQDGVGASSSSQMPFGSPSSSSSPALRPRSPELHMDSGMRFPPHFVPSEVDMNLLGAPPMYTPD
ncbi:hypothetical protein SCP_0313180 [Sparassis crispa]|uniref:Mid2 domain-containing protein n=1 Tax=Sparassis crispa TaxID=139825 RepID=A0A401GHE7_9APHY|nr:hypothetical protein SCP_0313180 [Sparassis crispa]GBE81589.1 hypothetical protein SCP_0313180 [Sparassis crispa]